MSSKRSPLTGYNTGIQYRGAPYHVQTEDSGIDHPHVITHLFARGGHILATAKTSYAEHVGSAAYPDVVREIIRTQHKQMIVALRNGAYDALLTQHANLQPTPGLASVPAPRALPSTTSPPRSAPARRGHRNSFTGAETTRDSLDEIIIADLIQLLDE